MATALRGGTGTGGAASRPGVTERAGVNSGYGPEPVSPSVADGFCFFEAIRLRA